jgi:hypothetical protein
MSARRRRFVIIEFVLLLEANNAASQTLHSSFRTPRSGDPPANSAGGPGMTTKKEHPEAQMRPA